MTFRRYPHDMPTSGSEAKRTYQRSDTHPKNSFWLKGCSTTLHGMNVLDLSVIKHHSRPIGKDDKSMPGARYSSCASVPAKSIPTGKS
ncbi:hypothetical protein V2G26_013585 [Clonostachys chloroleuca]